jgi:prepilin-type N-terminal cleavage/methylation domain-containing protein
MKISRPIHDQRLTAGFTLVELLVVIAIIGVVSGIGMRLFVVTTSYYGQAQSEAESDLAIQTALETVRDDVSSVLPSSLTGVSVQGILDKRGEKEDSVLVLPTSVPTLADRRNTAATVKYYIQRIQGTTRLMRASAPLHQKIPENAGTEVAAGVLAFHAEYLDDEGRWLPTWSDETSPVAVRVSLTLSDSDSTLAPPVTRSLVFRVPAR